MFSLSSTHTTRSLLVLLLSLFAILITTRLQETNKRFIKLDTSEVTIKTEVVESEDGMAKGLSGRLSLSDKKGMLFVFDQISQSNCFWMKDMHFAIDMVWLDEQKRVITISENVTPETYPNTFCPDFPAKYGLEIQANSAARYGIKTGESLSFPH